jgi:uncharacterized membrane protein YqgA involved in biofilm formation
MFTGVIANTAAVIAGSLFGRFVVKNISERFRNAILHSQGLFVVFIGVAGALECEYVLVLLFSLTVGGILGELIDIDRRMQSFGNKIGSKVKSENDNFSKGFVTAALLFCTGSMAVIGPMQSGLIGDHNMLYMKSVIDGSMSIFLASTLGIGVLFSAGPILLYEGLIAFGAGFVSRWIEPTTIAEMSAAGSILLIAIGLNLLDIKRIKVANLIPAVFMPWPLLSLYNFLVNMI